MLLLKILIMIMIIIIILIIILKSRPHTIIHKTFHRIIHSGKKRHRLRVLV